MAQQRARRGYWIKKPFWSSAWKALRPPPRVPGGSPSLNRSQKRLLLGTFAVLIPIAAGAAVFQYAASAEERSGKSLEKGKALLGAGHAQEAIAQFTRATEIWPQNAQAYFERGTVQQALNLPDAALADFEKALRINPNLAPAYTARGAIFIQRGDLSNALIEVEQSIQVHPTMDAYFQRGQIHYALGKFEQAIGDYDRAIALARDTPFIYLARASAKIAFGDAPGAAQDRETAASLTKGR